MSCVLHIEKESNYCNKLKVGYGYIYFRLMLERCRVSNSRLSPTLAFSYLLAYIFIRNEQTTYGMSYTYINPSHMCPILLLLLSFRDFSVMIFYCLHERTIFYDFLLLHFFSTLIIDKQ